MLVTLIELVTLRESHPFLHRFQHVELKLQPNRLLRYLLHHLIQAHQRFLVLVPQYLVVKEVIRQCLPLIFEHIVGLRHAQHR